MCEAFTHLSNRLGHRDPYNPTILKIDNEMKALCKEAHTSPWLSNLVTILIFFRNTKVARLLGLYIYIDYMAAQGHMVITKTL